MLIRSKWAAEKECNFNFAINSLLAGTNSYQRADRISFLILMKYKHSDFNLQLGYLPWCSRSWKTLSLFFLFFMKSVLGSIPLFVLLIPWFLTLWISCDDLIMFRHFLQGCKQRLMPYFHIWVWQGVATCKLLVSHIQGALSNVSLRLVSGKADSLLMPSSLRTVSTEFQGDLNCSEKK